MVRCHKISKDFQRDMKIVIAYCYLETKSSKTNKISMLEPSFTCKIEGKVIFVQKQNYVDTG